MLQLQPSTWRVLGLSVAAGYTGFGLFEILLPAKAGREFLAIEPRKDPAVDEAVAMLAPLMGARDLTIASALFAFHYTRRDKEMGVLIAAGTILCYADAIVIGARRGIKSSIFLGVIVGATTWAIIGLGLMANST